MTPTFLRVEDVFDIHTVQLRRFGGAVGVRDRAMLESAVAQPRVTVGGELAHADLFSMAAAYLFHLVQAHAFIDGNKRVGLLAALVFLEINGIVIEHDSETLYELTLSVAQGHVRKDEVAATLRRLAGEG